MGKYLRKSNPPIYAFYSLKYREDLFKNVGYIKLGVNRYSIDCRIVIGKNNLRRRFLIVLQFHHSFSTYNGIGKSVCENMGLSLQKFNKTFL